MSCLCISASIISMWWRRKGFLVTTLSFLRSGAARHCARSPKLSSVRKLFWISAENSLLLLLVCLSPGEQRRVLAIIFPKGLLLVLAKTAEPRILQCKMLAVEDPFYRWWLFESSEGENPCLYRFAVGNSRDTDAKFKGHIPSGSP